MAIILNEIDYSTTFGDIIKDLANKIKDGNLNIDLEDFINQSASTSFIEKCAQDEEEEDLIILKNELQNKLNSLL